MMERNKTFYSFIADYLLSNKTTLTPISSFKEFNDVKNPTRLTCVKKSDVDVFLKIMSVDTDTDIGEISNLQTITHNNVWDDKLFEYIKYNIYIASNNNIKIDYLNPFELETSYIKIYWHFASEDGENAKNEVKSSNDTSNANSDVTYQHNINVEDENQIIKEDLYENYSAPSVVKNGLAETVLEHCINHHIVKSIVKSNEWTDEINVTLYDIFNTIIKKDKKYVLKLFRINSNDAFYNYHSDNGFVYTNDFIETQKIMSDKDFIKDDVKAGYKGFAYATPNDSYMTYIGDEMHKLNFYPYGYIDTNKEFRYVILDKLRVKYNYKECAIVPYDSGWESDKEYYKKAYYKVYLRYA